MTLSTLSIQCLIAGYITLVLAIIKIITESQELWLVFSFESEHRSVYVQNHSCNLAAYGVAALTCILKIVGIKKRRAFLIVPWLIAALVIFAFVIHLYVFTYTILPAAYPAFVFFGIAAIGVLILIVYPACKLIVEIRHERAEEDKQRKDKPTFVRV